MIMFDKVSEFPPMLQSINYKLSEQFNIKADLLILRCRSRS